jgi:hypothetical protein
VNLPINQTLAQMAPKALERIARALSRPIDAVRVRIQNVFEDHLMFTLNRCSYVKTIVADEKPVHLRDIYVPLQLKSSSRPIHDFAFATKARPQSACLIRATAGAGKTMLMKYLALETYANSERIPIFIDLREIGDPGKESFLRSVFRLCTPEGSNKDYDLFNAGLNAGLFSFFFDGLDEINPGYRERTFRQIQRFPFDYPEVLVTISTRPETEVSGFTIYTIYYLDPFTLHQSVDLISKTEFHDELKKVAFVDHLNGGLYYEKLSFASNPLLCLLMLMTFSDQGEIPDRAASFYDQAFETLYSRHDTSKGPFRRIHRTGLGKREFKRVFGIFCYRTLANHQISFADIDLKRDLQRSIELSEVVCDTDDFLKDCLEGVCVLQRDEGKVDFIHRSFQEFFAADFLAHYRGKNIYSVFNQILSDTLATKVAPLLYDLNPFLMEEVWIGKAIDHVIKVLDQGKPSETAEYLSKFVSEITISIDGEVSGVGWIKGEEFSHIIKILDMIYPDAGLPHDGLSLVGYKMFPDGYEDFRNFLLKSPLSPEIFRRRLQEEADAIKKANRERKSMTSQIVTGFEVGMESHEFWPWFNETDLVKLFPETLERLRELKRVVISRNEQRRAIDILN